MAFFMGPYGINANNSERGEFTMLYENYKEAKRTVLEVLETLLKGLEWKDLFLFRALERTEENIQNSGKYGYSMKKVAIASLEEVMQDDLDTIQSDRRERALAISNEQDTLEFAAEDPSWEDEIIRAISQLQIKKNEC